ncbi:hypothetical protein QTP88_007399 [Uroleucon formosanum]
MTLLTLWPATRIALQDTKSVLRSQRLSLTVHEKNNLFLLHSTHQQLYGGGGGGGSDGRPSPRPRWRGSPLQTTVPPPQTSDDDEIEIHSPASRLLFLIALPGGGRIYRHPTLPRRPVVVLTSYPAAAAAATTRPLTATDASHQRHPPRPLTPPCHRSAAVDAPATQSRAHSKHIARQSTVLVYYCYNKVVEAATTTTASGHGGTYMYNSCMCIASYYTCILLLSLINSTYFDKLIVILRQFSNNKQIGDPVSDTKVFWIVCRVRASYCKYSTPTGWTAFNSTSEYLKYLRYFITEYLQIQNIAHRHISNVLPFISNLAFGNFDMEMKKEKLTPRLNSKSSKLKLSFQFHTAGKLLMKTKKVVVSMIYKNNKMKFWFKNRVFLLRYFRIICIRSFLQKRECLKCVTIFNTLFFIIGNID